MKYQIIDSEKLDYIESYFFAHHEDDFFYIVLHSLFNCISENELQVLYFENAKGNPVLKKTIENYIIKRTTNEPKRQFEGVALALLNKYSEYDFQTQLTVRKFVSNFIRTLSTKTIHQYFDLLIHSDRKYDRHRANEVADLIWNEEIEVQLIDNFHRYKDEYSLFPLIKNMDGENLCQLIQIYWTNEFPSNKIKSNIVKKISTLEIEHFSFLRDRDISFYIHVLNLKKIKIPESEIQELLNVVNEDTKYYFLWTIGMTGDWDQTIKFIEKNLNLAKN